MNDDEYENANLGHVIILDSMILLPSGVERPQDLKECDTGSHASHHI